jgi:tRNA(Ile)-lysidine synthase
MFQKFQNHINTNLRFLNGKKLLLAVSGGLDSMVLVNLFQKLDFEVGMAHCNFQLRGIESFGDQEFVQKYANSNRIPIYTTLFDTESFAIDHKMSTQVAARELRYHWFYELLENEGYDFLLTAHHADDNLETFLINLSRGTGLEGLTGIPQQNESIVRPLLPFSREEIENYAKENKIDWREDSSNASDKYLRNKIRHHLVPMLKEMNSDFLASFHKTQSFLQESKLLVQDATEMVYNHVVEEKEESIYINISKLIQLDNYSSYLYQWLKEFNFTAWNDIYDLVNAQSGKFIVSDEYRLLKDRNFLILSSFSEIGKQEFYVSNDQIQIDFPLKLSLCKVNDISNVSNTCIFVNKEMLKFPLKIRKWNEGDYFYPSGMQGKKKVSKFFKDEKFSLLEKEQTWFLCSENEIVWIIGNRADNRFLANKNTNNILKIEVH